jgi:hypothetical protein
MDNTSFTLEIEPRQVFRETVLTPEDRRLLLGASIRLLGHRYAIGKPILQDDVIRVASLADDVERAA